MSPGKRGVKREVCSLTEDALQVAETFKGEKWQGSVWKFSSLESFPLLKVFLSRKISSCILWNRIWWLLCWALLHFLLWGRCPSYSRSTDAFYLYLYLCFFGFVSVFVVFCICICICVFFICIFHFNIKQCFISSYWDGGTMTSWANPVHCQ